MTLNPSNCFPSLTAFISVRLYANAAGVRLDMCKKCATNPQKNNATNVTTDKQLEVHSLNNKNRAKLAELNSLDLELYVATAPSIHVCSFTLIVHLLCAFPDTIMQKYCSGKRLSRVLGCARKIQNQNQKQKQKHRTHYLCAKLANPMGMAPDSTNPTNPIVPARSCGANPRLYRRQTRTNPKDSQ